MGINPRIKLYWRKSQVSSNMVATSSGRVLAGPVAVLLLRLATAAPDSSNFQGKWSREGNKSEVTWKWRENEICVHGGNLKRSIFTLRHALNMSYASKESEGAIYLRFCSISYTSSPFLFPSETGSWSTETWQVRLLLAHQKPWGSWAPRWVHRQHRRPRGNAERSGNPGWAKSIATRPQAALWGQLSPGRSGRAAVVPPCLQQLAEFNGRAFGDLGLIWSYRMKQVKSILRWSQLPSLARSLNHQWQAKTQAILTYPSDIQRTEQHNSLCRQSRSQWIWK